ncbi:MAG TPA: hypothetical protein VGD36_04255 [Xanthobacteraceae bacterium]|jgi:hypothetical protein
MHHALAIALTVFATLAGGVAQAQAQAMFTQGQVAPAAPGPGGATGASLAAPDGGVTRSISPLTAPPSGVAQPLSPNSAFSAPGGGGAIVPPALGGVSTTARFARQAVPITSGLHWRVYPDKPDQSGSFRLLKEEKSANPTFVLPPGGYIVHVAVGLASAARRVQVRTDTSREVFELPAGGVRFEGRVGDTRIPTSQVSFDVYRGSQFDLGDKRPVASEVPTGDLVMLPEGTYHVVSNYGDGNAVMRYDFRVQTGRLTDARINHRAAVITLKLVSERGGEALANTAWSVLTPGGDVIKESIGAFPSVVLAEGDYVAIARNEGKVFNREFKVEPGFDREIELLAR